MKLAFAVIAAVTLSSVPVFGPAHAQVIGPKTRINKCGIYKRICESARMSHVAANYNVSGLLHCHYGGCGFNLKRGEYYYLYWR